MSTFVLVNGIGDTVVAFRGALVRELVTRGHRVVVSTPRPVEVSAAQVEEALRALGAECEFSPLDRTGLNPLSELAARRHYAALFRRTRPDGVFVANPKPVFHALPAAAACGVPRRVAMITGLGYAFIGSSLKARLLRVVARGLYARAMRAATCTLFQNADDQGYFARTGLLPRGADARIVGGSGVDLEAFPERPVPEGACVFLMVARLLGDKGVREYAAAARLVRAARPACRFRLVGWIDANPAAIARSELDAWTRDGVLEYAGRLDDVRGELAACSVFVLPSYREGAPKSTLEALATGRAVVTTDVPGCRETVEDGVNGLLVPARDARALADACLRLADDPAAVARMGAASAALARRRFDARLVNAAIADALGA
ncbi:MAG: glycosyltransferase family 4 protein [Planctomycetota bacterium]